MQKDVTQGESYCLTVYSVPCKVTAIGENNIEYTLLNVSETGQYLFIAPTWKVNISQDDASIVKTFNLAGTGKVGGSGSGFDPASDQTISGAWSFTNTAGLVLGNEVPLVLGQGDDAVKIHVNANGDVNIGGALTAESATINGPLVVNNPNGSAETLHQIYGITRFYQSVDLRWGGWLRGTFMVETGILNISQGASFNCAGPSTFSSTVNANGGINIPLAAGAPMDMMAVNRLYAAGMAGVTNIYTQRTYLDTGSITATGAAASTAIIPGQYAKTVIPANTHSTVVHNFIGPVGQWNYSSFAGLSVPWQLSAAGKFAIGIGRGNKTVRKDLTLDSYSIIPGNDLAYNTGEILDITFTNVRDTTRSGYEIRVREIYCTESTQRWKVKTTTSFIPASGNEPIPYIVNKIIYQQYAPRSYIAGDYGDAYGALYLLTGGGSNQQLWKIATVRGVTTFETGPGFSSIVSDVLGVSGGSVGLFVGTAERTNYQPGNVNPVYYALEAITSNAIETESTADFVDINEPFKS